MFAYILLLLFAGLCYLFSLRGKFDEVVSFIFLAFILIFFAGFRHPGIDADSINYRDFVVDADSLGNYFRSFEEYTFSEPFYYLIASLVKTLGLPIFCFFLIFAAFGVGLKFYALQKLTPFIFLSAFIYCCHFFFLHEMTQIRTGVAAGFLFLAIPYIQKRKPIHFIVIILVGVCFHYSLVIALPFYFLNPNKLNRVFYIGLILVPYLLIALGFNFITILSDMNLGTLSDKLKVYSDLLDAGEFDKINIFNVELLLQIALCFLFIWKSETLASNNPYALILLKIYIFSVASFVFLSPMPVFAFRVAGLLEEAQIVLVPFLLYVIKPRTISYAMIISIAFLLFGIAIFYAKYMDVYNVDFS